MSDSAEHMAYVGYCGECGGIVAAVVDEPGRPRETAKDVARYVRDGYRVERVTCQFVRENLRGCAPGCPCRYCEKRRKKASRASSVEKGEE